MRLQYHALYIGPIESLHNKSALIFIDNEECTAQFDDMSLPYSHNWHTFPKEHFTDLRPLNQE